MSFRDVALLTVPRSLRWRPVEGVGLEHLTLRSTPDGLRAEAVVIGDRGDGLLVDLRPGKGKNVHQFSFSQPKRRR